jgi:Icc-related predicted phosphoesterase
MKKRVFFVSDLHGLQNRYTLLFNAILDRKPGLVLLGGDLLPHPRTAKHRDFILEFLAEEFGNLKNIMKDDYPQVGLILGNDDARIFESSVLEGEKQGFWKYLHMRRMTYSNYEIIGYSYVPPTPFRLKDWERYDVSRYVDPGSTAPDEGVRSVGVNPDEIEYSTIQKDLKELFEDSDPGQAICLFHSPPYQSFLDRAALDGMVIEFVPLDVHVGSIAIKRFIEDKKPYITLHGHIHESSRITGHWRQQFGTTHSFSAALEGEELALISFEIDNPADARREILTSEFLIE